MEMGGCEGVCEMGGCGGKCGDGRVWREVWRWEGVEGSVEMGGCGEKHERWEGVECVRWGKCARWEGW